MSTHHDSSAAAWEAGAAIRSDLTRLATEAVERQFDAAPQMRRMFTGDKYRSCVEDTEYHLMALAQSLLADEPAVFEDYAVWAKILLANLGLPPGCLEGSLTVIRDTLSDRLATEPAAQVVGHVERAMLALTDVEPELSSVIADDAPLAEIAREYLESLLGGDRTRAAGLVHDVVKQGVALPDVYEHVFTASQHEVGRLWQVNQLSVAMEHYATGATQVIMSQFFTTVWSTPVKSRRFVGACVQGELHDMGMRMACDVMRYEGWDAYCLGANTPDTALRDAINELEPSVVGISATLPFHVDNVRRAIEVARETDPSLTVVVGGAIFDRTPGLAEKVGADGWLGRAALGPRRLDEVLASA